MSIKGGEPKKKPKKKAAAKKTTRRQLQKEIAQPELQVLPLFKTAKMINSFSRSSIFDRRRSEFNAKTQRRRENKEMISTVKSWIARTLSRLLSLPLSPAGALSQPDLLQEFGYAGVLAQLGEARVHLQFRGGHIVVLGSFLQDRDRSFFFTEE